MFSKTAEEPRGRLYPTARSCWPGLTIASFSLYTSERDVLLRHICMIGTLSLHTLISILVIVAVAFRFSIISRIILAVLGFGFRLHLRSLAF